MAGLEGFIGSLNSIVVSLKSFVKLGCFLVARAMSIEKLVLIIIIVIFMVSRPSIQLRQHHY